MVFPSVEKSREFSAEQHAPRSPALQPGSSTSPPVPKRTRETPAHLTRHEHGEPTKSGASCKCGWEGARSTAHQPQLTHATGENKTPVWGVCSPSPLPPQMLVTLMTALWYRIGAERVLSYRGATAALNKGPRTLSI